MSEINPGNRTAGFLLTAVNIMTTDRLQNYIPASSIFGSMVGPTWHRKHGVEPRTVNWLQEREVDCHPVGVRKFAEVA
jgi:hypothetical protein